MTVYSIDKLMTQTRQLASEYYKTTGQALPVTTELSRYDAVTLCRLNPISDQDCPFDATDEEEKRYIIKGRVIFNESERGYRMGQITEADQWDRVLLVLYNAQYEPQSVFQLTREQFLEALNENPNPNRSKRGAMSVAKFKALGSLVWSSEMTGVAQ